MKPPIYEPTGKAKEYGDYALNIYTGCPHRCFYCFAPSVAHIDRERFHSNVRPRPCIVEETKKQLEKEGITGKTIHLCFTCDPYPAYHRSLETRYIIELLKQHGNHVQILTKGDGSRDFDLLDSNDWYGITLDQTQNESFAPLTPRLGALMLAHGRGIKTWVSFEPVTYTVKFFEELHMVAPFVDRVKIGKMNYHKSNIDWCEFGKLAEAECKALGLDYYIKESLREEMKNGD